MFRRLLLGNSKNVAPLAALSWIVTVKDLLGIEKVVLDKDPIKDKIKQSMLHRRLKRHNEAVDVLHDALKDAQDSKNEMYVSRVYDELANTYYEMEDLDKAEKLFRDLIARLIRLHGKSEESPEFIGISLKLADIYAQRGDLETAEVGLKHCVSKQMKKMEEHFKNYYLSKGAYWESLTPVEDYGAEYTDPVVLFAMALEQYAFFLVDYFGEDRLKEVEEYMDEVLKISYHVYGVHDPHSLTVLNNIGTKCLLKGRYELAKKYLEIGINRVLLINECSSMLVSYYCGYAEACFHCGEPEKALEYASKAERFAKSQEPRVQEYTKRFRRDLERDSRNSRRIEKVQKQAPSDPSQSGQEEDVQVSWWRSWIPV